VGLAPWLLMGGTLKIVPYAQYGERFLKSKILKMLIFEWL